MGGPEMAPQTPQRSERPGTAGSLLYPRRSERPGTAGSLLYPRRSERPGTAGSLLYPPMFGAPRHSRVAPLTPILGAPRPSRGTPRYSDRLPGARRRPQAFDAARARVARHARAAKRAAGSQTHRVSLASTARPHALKKRRIQSGETTIGRHGR